MLTAAWTVTAAGDRAGGCDHCRSDVADASTTIAVETDERAQIGDQVTFAWNDYSTYLDLPYIDDPGGWTIGSSGNPVYARHLGASTVNFDHRSEPIHEAGELTAVSNLDCGTGYTCFVLVHDGVSDKIRLPTLNEFGLDDDYAGGLCAEVIAPAGIRYDSGVVLGYYLDVAQPTWMRVWAKP